MLDTLSGRLADAYPDAFQIINSESSQFFCAQIYPLIVSFETKLRYALYISRALFENGNVNKKSFGYTVGKTEKLIEEIDFGEIYDAVFTDKDLKHLAEMLCLEYDDLKAHLPHAMETLHKRLTANLD